MSRMILSLAGLLVLAIGPGIAQDLPRVPAGKAKSDHWLIQERRELFQYALDDEKAAKAAADEAKARAERDQAAYNGHKLSAAELSASLAAREKFFFDYLAKGTLTKLARHKLGQALFVNVPPTSVQTLLLVELFKPVSPVREKQLKLEYALNNEKAARAVADEAKARAERDQAAYNAKALSAADLSASLAAKEKFFYDYLATVTAANLVRHDLQRTTLFANFHATSVQDLLLIEVLKVLVAVQEKQDKLQYALHDEKAAKAAADEAKARAERDQAAYNAKALSAADLSVSLAAKEKFFYEYQKKGTEVRIARAQFERAKQSLNLKAR